MKNIRNISIYYIGGLICILYAINYFIIDEYKTLVAIVGIAAWTVTFISCHYNILEKER